MGPPKSKRPRRRGSPDPDDEDDDERLPYFVPEEGIDIEPLALYARGILDREAQVKTGTHPQRPEQKGFWIMSGIAVTREDIAAMIEDTRLWRKEEKKGYYLESETAKRRLRMGRAQAAKERPMAAPRTKRESEERRPSMPQPISRGSADNVTMSERYRQMSASSTMSDQRPASAQGIQPEGRRSSTQPYPPGSGYNISATAQYTMSMNAPPSQYQSYSQDVYDTEAPPPPPYTDAKRGGGNGHPSTTGTQGFQSLYATSGGPLPPPPGPPQQQQQQQRRHHGSG